MLDVVALLLMAVCVAVVCAPIKAKEHASETKSTTAQIDTYTMQQFKDDLIETPIEDILEKCDRFGLPWLTQQQVTVDPNIMNIKTWTYIYYYPPSIFTGTTVSDNCGYFEQNVSSYTTMIDFVCTSNSGTGMYNSGYGKRRAV